MATLTRLRPLKVIEIEGVLNSQVPAPFPTEILQEERAKQGHGEHEESESDPFADQPSSVACSQSEVNVSVELEESSTRGSEELLAVRRKSTVFPQT